ncbi:MAG: gliding motility lipoprotein GldH [Bacteroidetes bacterium]|nr:MAG: gliding motility lipoprotein GldH [Bacteroidota bacterium]
MNIRILAILFLSSFILLSCDSRVIFEDNIRIPENRWYQDNIIRLQAEIPDTVTPLNLYINVRNASGYQFSNLFLFMNTITPDSMIARDTVEIQLADESGRWMGDGMGDIWDNRILFKKNFRFPVAGTYTFELQQAMRVNPLPQIMDAGIRIERAE